MRRELAIGLDIGTTGCKAVAVTPAGEVIASVGRTYPLITPSPQAAEQDALAIRQASLDALGDLASQVDAAAVKAIALSGAMHSLVPIGRNDQPLTNALTWADTRPAAICDEIRASLSDKALRSLRNATGCPMRWTYHAPRLRWLRHHEEAVFNQAVRFVSITEFVTHALSGHWVCDTSLASTTGLLDTRTNKWADDALRIANVTHNQLGTLVESGQPIGQITKSAGKKIGLPGDVMIVAGGSDGALANLGSGAGRAGEVAISVGTSGAVRAVVEQPTDGDDTLWCYQLHPGKWVAGGAINNAGLLINWVCTRFYMPLKSDDDDERTTAFEQMFSDAGQVAPGAEGVTVLPLLTGERNPNWQPDTSAAITGLTLNHTRAHIARAALESVGFCLADIFEKLPPDVTNRARPRITGGITKSATWLQIVADVLGCDLHPTESPDASAIGAAALAWAHLTGDEPTTFVRDDSDEQRVVRFDVSAHETYQLARARFRYLSPIAGIG